MSYCKWTGLASGDKCKSCGYTLDRDYKSTPHRPCHSPGLGDRLALCVHLGEPTGAVELILCQTCRGNVRQKFPVSACEVFGTCLPTMAHENASGVKGCGSCPRRS
jgi:hypothetical protein